MRFLKMLCLVAIVGLMSAAAVKADSAPGDPKFLISKPGDPVCPPPGGADYVCFSENSALDPVFVPDLNTPFEFVWDGSTALTELWTSFNAGPAGTIYSCASVDIFTTPFGPGMPSCLSYSTGVANVLGFVFNGSATDNLPGCTGGADCSGVSAVLESPEPNSMLLLVSLGLPAIGFARKRWNLRQSA
jgi:hypothetical protein